MRYHRLSVWLISFVIILIMTGPVQSVYRGEPDLPVSEVLVALELPDGAAALARFEALGRPLYIRLPAPDGDILLTTAVPGELDALDAAGTSLQVLDPSPASGSYFVAYVAPGRPRPNWNEYGRLLLAGGNWYLLRLEPSAAGRLAAVGVELQAVTLTPKPLRSVAAVPNFPESIDPDPTIQSMMDQVLSGTVSFYDGGLSGEFPVDINGEPYTIASRYTYSGLPIQKATQYVGEHLDDLGLLVEYHQWSGPTYPNVIGEIEGETNPEEIYIISAHLDDMPSGSVAPGADDNASGVTAVLIAADILSQYRWDCTLRFALFTGEEQGLNGSAAYAQRSYYSGENIQGVLNLDMIGWNTPASSPDIDLHASSNIPNSVALAQLFADVVGAYNLDLVPQIITNGTGASDHASFWDYNYAAILGIEDYYGGGDFNPYYHTTQDLLEHLDMDYFTEFVKAGVGSFVHMSGCLIEGGSGTLGGLVSDATTTQPISSATVEMFRDKHFQASTTTNGSGYYSYTLGVGTYTVTVSAANYLSSTITGLTIITDTVTTQNFALEPVVEETYSFYTPYFVGKNN